MFDPYVNPLKTLTVWHLNARYKLCEQEMRIGMKVYHYVLVNNIEFDVWTSDLKTTIWHTLNFSVDPSEDTNLH